MTSKLWKINKGTNNPAKTALTSFAKSIKKPIREANIINANVGEHITRKLSLIYKNYSFRIYAATSLLEIDIDIDDLKLVFSVNLPDKIFLLNKKIDTASISVPIYTNDTFISDELIRYIHRKKNIQLLESLNLSSKEGLFIARNGMYFVCEYTRNIKNTMNILIQIANSLPKSPNNQTKGTVIDGLEFHKEKLPEDLRPLSQYIRKYAISDDTLREEKLNKLSKKEKQNLITAVSPYMDSINTYLDSFKDKPLSNEAVLLGYLAETVSELIIER
ncbi:MAG TPA: hypothetical protein VK338_01070 [Candidatus Nitrosocosmicus sp.]|nr:hypothetical protein [Candidatus Nitrosocosmicus sp.]